MDQLLTRWELRGQNTANTLHRWSINLILMGIGYNLFTIVRGYNNTMFELRVGLPHQNAAEDDDNADDLRAIQENSQPAQTSPPARPGQRGGRP